MKKTYLILIILFVIRSVSAQDATYLKQSSVEKGIIIFEATELYINLPEAEKPFAIRMALSNDINNDIIVIDYGHTREMWRKDAVENKLVRFDTLNINKLDLQRFMKKRSEKFMAHPWFFNIGLNYMFSEDVSEDGLLSVYINTRVGFFLLLNKWDLAASFTLGVNDANGVETTAVSIGLISKYYFPLKTMPLSPYVGGGISYNFRSMYSEYSETEDSYVDLPINLGVSWRLGPGSLDAGIQFGLKTDFMTVIGYTFCPWANRR